MTQTEKHALWAQEEQSAEMHGWDFSHIRGRVVEAPLPWDYKQKVLDFLKPQSVILDMGTGGGEFLLSLRHPFLQTSVTESWQPNFELCEKKLAPLGITVRKTEEDKPLPFADNSFDLVLNRHDSYDVNEVRRVLKPGGYFITQQVGGSNNLRLRALLGNNKTAMPSFNLENELLRFKTAGFTVNFCDQAYVTDHYLDVGALVWYAKVLPWEFGNFTVENCLPQLDALDALCEKQGYIPSVQHRFMLIVRNRKPKE